MHDPVLVTNPARPREHGSGFVIRRLPGDTGAEVVTCAHVVRALGVAGLRVGDQPATVVIDLGAQGIDLAVLSVTGLGEHGPLELGCGTAGEEVELLGFEPAGGGPLAVPHRGRLAKASVTALAGRNRPAWHLALEDGAIQGGHSGGPVISVRTGKVVGVIAMGPDQQGGRDGVAVAIENLRAWPQAPAIASARPLTGPGASTSSDDALPRPPWQRRWRWIAIGGGSLVAAAAVAIAVQPAPAEPPSNCAVPDIHLSFEDAPVEAWCPDAIDGVTSCPRFDFDDGSVVTGRCRGTDAIGEWSARDRTGFERWHVRFAEPGRHPTAIYARNERLTSGALVRTEIRRGVMSGSRTFDAATRELSCKRAEGFASVIREQADLASPAVEVTLTVPGGVLSCTIEVQDTGLAALTSDDRVGVCSIDEQVVRDQFAADSYQRLLSAEQVIRSCNLPPLPPLAQCGDGRKSAGEECDAGGRDTVDCDADCTRPRCGDAHVNPATREQCDAGGETSTCDADCTLQTCGDGRVNAVAEQCEPARGPRGTVPTATCNANCTAARCGDGIINPAAGESCESGEVDTATCDHDCTKVACNDGIFNRVAEECDPPVARVCTTRCKKAPLRSP